MHQVQQKSEQFDGRIYLALNVIKNELMTKMSIAAQNQ